jgi:hypothetical protein
MSQSQDWKVQLFPEEQAFIDEIWRRVQTDAAGRGRYLAPIRGGVIWIDEEYYGLNEDQIKWLLLVRLHEERYRVTGFKGLKFMNFNYNGELPGVLEDAEAMDKWGVKRTTTDGQPVSDETGYPLTKVIQEVTMVKEYQWNSESKEFQPKAEQEPVVHLFDHEGLPVPAKVLE